MLGRVGLLSFGLDAILLLLVPDFDLYFLKLVGHYFLLDLFNLLSQIIDSIY